MEPAFTCFLQIQTTIIEIVDSPRSRLYFVIDTKILSTAKRDDARFVRKCRLAQLVLELPKLRMRS